MVSPDFENLGVSFEVMMQVFKGFDNGKKFFIMNVIDEFSIDY